MGKIRLCELKETIEQSVDIFCCFASFEDRCLTIPETLNDRIERAVIFSFENPTAPNHTKRNINSLKKMFKGKHLNLALSRDNPIKIAEGIINLMYKRLRLEEGPSKELLIDFSTFSREVLLIFLKWILDTGLDKKHHIRLVYNSAGDYSVNEKNEDEKWLTRGIGEIRSILGYPGLLSPTQKLHLVIMVGFEFERALKFIEAYEPSITSLGMGGKECSIAPELQEINRRKHQMIKDWYGNVNEFCFSCVDPLQTKEDLKKQIDKYPGYNVVVAPLNTKISTIGAALLAVERPEIQLCYADANIYNIDGYSIPGEDCYLFDLDQLIKR